MKLPTSENLQSLSFCNVWIKKYKTRVAKFMSVKFSVVILRGDVLPAAFSFQAPDYTQ